MAVAALCPGTPRPAGQPSKIPLGVARHPSPTLRNQGQERCLRERWSRGWAGAWAGCRAPSPVVWGSLPSSPSAVLGSDAPEDCTSPLLTQQPFQPQENPFPLTTAHPRSPLRRPGQAGGSSGAALSQPRCSLAAHTTAVNGFSPGSYFGHGPVGRMPLLQTLWDHPARARRHPQAPGLRNPELCSGKVSATRRYFGAQHMTCRGWLAGPELGGTLKEVSIKTANKMVKK